MQNKMSATASKVDTSGSLFSMKSFVADKDLPIVYSPKYNISLWGIELMHQFDTRKYMKLAQYLNDEFLDTVWARNRHADEALDEEDEKWIKEHPEQARNSLRRLRYLKPNRPVNDKELMLNHTDDYIKLLKNDKSFIARVTEIWLLNLIPYNLIENNLLKPIRWQVAGTIYAAHLAIQHGWSMNLGGGFHQSSSNNGETFCFYSDIMLTIKYIWRKHPLQKFMIIDLDAHQAIGLEKDICDLTVKLRKKVFMLDVFNNSIQPPNPKADKGIDLRVELNRFTGDETYLQKLSENLELAFQRFKPTLIIYVAGQDILDGDSLGLMNITDDGLKRRDELVLQWAVEKQKCAILILLGGGYLVRGAKVLADSIKSLYGKSLIWGGHRSGSRSLSRPRADKNNNKDGKSNSNNKSIKTHAQSSNKTLSNSNQLHHHHHKEIDSNESQLLATKSLLHKGVLKKVVVHGNNDNDNNWHKQTTAKKT